MKTTAGIMAGLRSIAWANECRRDAKHVWAQPRVVDGGRHKVSVLQVQAWQFLFPDQRLLDTDTGHRTATASKTTPHGNRRSTTQPISRATATIMTVLLIRNTPTFKLSNVFPAAVWNSYRLPLLPRWKIVWEQRGRNKVLSFLTFGVTSVLYS